MYRRCHFMEESYHMRYFEGKIPSKDQSGQFIQLDAKNLRSSLLDIMKNEVSEMCLSGNDQGFQPPHMQVSIQHSFYGLQGHPYDCFPMGLNYMYIFLCHIPVVCVVKEVIYIIPVGLIN